LNGSVYLQNACAIASLLIKFLLKMRYEIYTATSKSAEWHWRNRQIVSRPFHLQCFV